ncbi:1013_t:CDS:1 [Diversispora eburnea]|uniref:1013_t:CDS:1 n=1 Tax=Diversispora eburnea TaxID=1213867 RepID=A0A9N9FXQ2_9GLOM|nr:1013_t:CDS:1 [Diversispora eburnea]
MNSKKISDQELHTFFSHIDLDNSGTINAIELQRVLLNGDWTPFNTDTIQLLLNLFDTNRNGTIHFEEFLGLWRYIEDWKRIFAAFDKDNSGNIDINELSLAMNNFGLNISEEMLSRFIKRYKIKNSTLNNEHQKKVIVNQKVVAINQGNLAVNFDSFVQLCVTVKSLTEAFRVIDGNNDGWAKLNYEQFMELIVKYQ